MQKNHHVEHFLCFNEGMSINFLRYSSILVHVVNFKRSIFFKLPILLKITHSALD